MILYGHRYAAAVTFELVTVLLILPLFYGWWTLDSKLTLSPLNIALAFESPLLKDVNSAAGAKDIVQQIGDERIRYGEALSDDEIVVPASRLGAGTTGRLGIGMMRNVTRPRSGMQFSK